MTAMHRNSYISIPGQILLDEFLRPMNITQAQLARTIGKPESAVSALVNGKRGITTEMAVLLGEVFGTSVEFWMDLESTYREKAFDRGRLP